ncbi:hypothetical protein CDAR_320491 [Caerostris darwini]|uniref:Secreted protein n=1 Tax=Caerostris darwini TaxID=1538125 RepID=A0AAV4X0A9_9ARAC|nr:hypothetical protein CDAR_320491 [Caerostris darwini]
MALMSRRSCLSLFGFSLLLLTIQQSAPPGFVADRVTPSAICTHARTRENSFAHAWGSRAHTHAGIHGSGRVHCDGRERDFSPSITPECD